MDYVSIVHPAQDPFTNGLVAYYPFNGDANDESGNGNNGTVTGAVLTADRFGMTNKAFHFNGAGDRISASVASIPLGNSPRSIVAWIKPDSDGHPVNGVIDYGNGDCTGLMFGISFSKYLGGTPNYNNLGFWGGCQDYASSLITPTNQWSFVALTYDGSNIRLYANGGSETNAIGPLNTQNSHLWIGAETLNDGGTFRDFFKGSIDDVRIYNRALSQQEVQQLYFYELNELPYLTVAVKTIQLNMFVALGKTNQLEASTNLITWTDYGSPFIATNSVMYQDVDVLNGQRFFRIREIGQ
ncbi:MAG: LamG domain-containing protein [Verrucomicrobia bacterium]|nr:LamG domain-containing protein [Verrucomicrobiota bacterium]